MSDPPTNNHGTTHGRSSRANHLTTETSFGSTSSHIHDASQNGCNNQNADHDQHRRQSVIHHNKESSFSQETDRLLTGDTDGLSNNIKSRSNFFIYLSHFLSAWGDRMWSFAVGLFLVEIAVDTLQLTAIFGLVMGGTILLGAPVVGAWVDRTPRLRAARLTIVLQNTLTAVCAGVVYAEIEYTTEIDVLLGSWSRVIVYAVIITLSSLADLSSVANTIAVEKDWIVEICYRDESRLANMTATMRVIDLTTQIMAPIATGLVMTYASTPIGAIFIGGWNLVSMVFEYYLILWVYNTVPQLAQLKNKSKRQERKENIPAEEDQEYERDGNVENKPLLSTDTKLTRNGGCCQACSRLCSGVMVIFRGWGIYASYDVMLSGLALSLLYMTVLGFDNVTVGYAKLEGLSDSIVGVMMGLGGLIGILGATAYPTLRRLLGLPKAGVVALVLQVACLSACVVSIWLPGSPSDLLDSSKHEGNCSTDGNMTAPSIIVPSGNATARPCTHDDNSSLLSVYVLMVGIVTARFGLWVADLSITQMFLQTVAEHERGVVNGVQNAINKLQDMLKFGLVVALPKPRQFGLLVIISFLAVALGLLMFVIFYVRLPRGAFSSEQSAKHNEKRKNAV